MSNPLVQDKASYIKELQNQMNSKPSKLDIYKAKLNEREFYEKNNPLDYFGKSGGGAPLRGENGNIKTARRTIDYEEHNYPNSSNNQQYIQQPPIMNYPPYQQNQRDIMNKTPIQNVYPQQGYQLPLSPYVNQNRPVSYHPPSQIEPMVPSYFNQNQPNDFLGNSNYQQSLPPQINSNPSAKRINSTRKFENGAPQYNNQNENTGLGILPQDRPNDKLEIQKKILKEDWLMQIEEKKRRENEEKRKKLEEDQLDEGKWMQYIEDKKRKDKQESIRKATESFPMPRHIDNMPQHNEQFSQVKSPSNINRQNQSQSQNQNQVQEHTFQTIKQPNEPFQDQYQRMLNMNYANLGKTLDDNIQDQIAKLRGDVNSQYIEMSEMFNKLKMDVCEANQLKTEAERELQYIKDELLKQKMQNIVYETKLNNVLEKNAPYNNLHIPLKEVDPMYNAYNQKPYNLRSTSDMVYANDIVDERAANRTKQLSALAQVGQSLVGESEFVPIPDNTNKNKKDMNEQYNRGKPIDNGNSNVKSFNQSLEGGDESIKVLDSFMKKGQYNDMYNKLSDIADINHQIDPINKCNTLTKNLEIDYKMFNNNQRNEEEIKKLDDMLNQLVENTNQY